MMGRWIRRCPISSLAVRSIRILGIVRMCSTGSRTLSKGISGLTRSLTHVLIASDECSQVMLSRTRVRNRIRKRKDGSDIQTMLFLRMASQTDTAESSESDMLLSVILRGYRSRMGDPEKFNKFNVGVRQTLE